MSLITSTEQYTQARAIVAQRLSDAGLDIDNLTPDQLPDVARMIAYYQREVQYNKLAYFEPYDYQRPLYHLHTMAQAVIASNRSGKSYSVGYAIACHLTGRYPEWWTDIRYRTGIKLIAAGASTNQIREAIQETLFGTADKTDELSLGSGLLPRDSIILDSIVTGADKRSIGGCQIRHSSGRSSQLVVASYEQDRAVLQGGKADVIWLDEQPSDDEIVSELIRALAQTPSRQAGRLYLSATPLVGWTPMIKRFWNSEPHHGMVRYTWDNVPLELLDQPTRDLLSSSWLPWELESRTQGIPMAGTGAVFQIDYNTVVLSEPPRLEPWYRHIAGIDFGRSPDPTAIIWVALDPRTDTMYIYDEQVCRSMTPIEYSPYILNRGRNIPLAWPPDGNRKGYTETTSAIHELTNRYGVRTLDSSFTNPDGSRGIDYGLQYMIQRMRLGTLKISPHCVELLDEMRQYHTNKTAAGRVQFQGSDHLIDAARYAVLSAERYSINWTESNLNSDPLVDAAWIEKYEVNTY